MRLWAAFFVFSVLSFSQIGPGNPGGGGGGGGSATPGGSPGSVQANASGKLGGSPFSFNLASVDATVAFTGSGTNDLWPDIYSSSYTDGAANPFATFTVVIDGTGTPDTFKWKKNNGPFTTGVPAASLFTDIPLSDGVNIQFVNATGHTLNDSWTVATGTQWTIWQATASGQNPGPVMNMQASNYPLDEIGYLLGGTIGFTGHRFLNPGYLANGWGNNQDLWDLPVSSLFVVNNFGNAIPSSMVFSAINGPVRFGTGSFPSTEYLRLDTSGKLGVGPFPDFLNPSPTGISQTYISVEDPSVLGAESLTNGALTGGTSWTAAGDWALTGGAATYTHSTGAGTLTQTSGTLATAGVGSRWYLFQYSVSGTTGASVALNGAPPITCNVTNAFASATTPMFFDSSTATSHTYFQSAASPGDFVISCTSTATGTVTIDNLSLKEITGGNIDTGNSVHSSVLGTKGRTLAYINALTLADGDQIYCYNCTVTSGVDDTCTTGGSGASVVRVNGVLRCRI